MANSNNAIAQAALGALTASGYPVTNNLCQKFARMVVQKVVGHQFDAVLQKASAKEAALSLYHAGIAFPKSQLAAKGGLQAGDLLYKTVGSGGFGHVGIYIGDNKVAENSSVHWKASGGRDARGVRTLAAFGDFQYVARFNVPSAPVEKPKTAVAVKSPKLFIEGNAVEAEKIEGHWHGGPQEAFKAAGFVLVTDNVKTTAAAHYLKVNKR
jgi:hypothetical protein